MDSLMIEPHIQLAGQHSGIVSQIHTNCTRFILEKSPLSHDVELDKWTRVTPLIEEKLAAASQGTNHPVTEPTQRYGGCYEYDSSESNTDADSSISSVCSR
jgi:hypothetical protein